MTVKTLKISRIYEDMNMPEKREKQASSDRSELLYSKRNGYKLDKLGNYYIKHAQAMTVEGLHDKSDIAAELAYRDAVINHLLDSIECPTHYQQALEAIEQLKSV